MVGATGRKVEDTAGVLGVLAVPSGLTLPLFHRMVLLPWRCQEMPTHLDETFWLVIYYHRLL